MRCVGDYECDGCPKAERPFNCHAIDNVTLEADGTLSTTSPVTQARCGIAKKESRSVLGNNRRRVQHGCALEVAQNPVMSADSCC